MAFSNRRFPKKHHGQMASEMTSICMGRSIRTLGLHNNAGYAHAHGPNHGGIAVTLAVEKVKHLIGGGRRTRHQETATGLRVA